MSLKTQLKEKTKYKLPSNYSVVIYNDNFTPFDFVHEILMKIFNKTKKEAEDIAMEIHNKGIAVAGVYPKSIAETKHYFVKKNAIDFGYPLACEIIKEDNED